MKQTRGLSWNGSSNSCNYQWHSHHHHLSLEQQWHSHHHNLRWKQHSHHLSWEHRWQKTGGECGSNCSINAVCSINAQYMHLLEFKLFSFGIKLSKKYTQFWQSRVSVGHSSCLHWLEKKDGSMESHSIPVIYVPWKPSNKNCPDLLFMCRLILWLPQVLIALMLRLWFLGVLPHHQHFRREYISHEAHY